MRVRAAGQKGMSLVEATIILMVLAILTAIFAPVASDYVNDAKFTKAKEDVEVIGMAIQRVLRDSGLPCLWDKQSSTGNPLCTMNNRVDLLVSSGKSPTVDGPAFNVAGNAIDSLVNWAGATNEVSANQQDTMNDQFVTNAADYPDVSFAKTSGNGPRSAMGWRGAYVTGTIDADPWGYKYQANTVFLGVATDAAAGSGEGQKAGGWLQDVVVISSGPNGRIQTVFASASDTESGGTDGTLANFDDVYYVVQGATR